MRAIHYPQSQERGKVEKKENEGRKDVWRSAIGCKVGAVDRSVKQKAARDTAANAEKMGAIEGGLSFFKITLKCAMRS
jgi:hypothetical protein